MNPLTVQGKAIPSSVRDKIIESWLEEKGPTQIGKELQLQKQTIRDLKQPGQVCGRRREKTSEVWVENVIQSGKTKCLSKLPSWLVAEVGRLH